MACADLPHADLSGAEAPTSLVSASLVGDGPAQYCDVKGWIAPQTQFELRLPTSTWQGRYLQTGCGGNCGVVTIAVSPPADTDAALGSNTFAVSTNDAGDVVRTYPVPVYPARAQYTGSGDVNDAANWTSASPASPPDDHFAWLGDPAGSLVGGDAQR
jgi:hypothetical protein